MGDSRNETNGLAHLPRSFFYAIGQVGWVLNPDWFNNEDQRKKFVDHCATKGYDSATLGRLVHRMTRQRYPDLEVISHPTSLALEGPNFLADVRVNLAGIPAAVRLELVVGRRMPDSHLSPHGRFNLFFCNPIDEDPTHVQVDTLQELALSTFKSWPPDRAEGLLTLLRRHGARLPETEPALSH